MKRIIRLTESDLTRLVRRVISEQGTGAWNQGAYNPKSYTGEKVNDWDLYMDVNRDNGTLKMIKPIDCEVFGALTGNELRILKGTTFKKVSPDELVAKGVQIQFVGDFIGNSKGYENNKTIRISCSTLKVKVDGKSEIWFGENWRDDHRAGFKELCKNNR
jgi:hypothetical protein